MTPHSWWFKVSLEYYLHNTILSSKGPLFWWGRPPGHTHHLEHARRSIFYVELCDLYICAHENWFPSQLGWPPLATGLGPPRKWRRGLKICPPPIIFGQLGPFWRQKQQRNQRWHKNPTGAVSVTYRTTLYKAEPSMRRNALFLDDLILIMLTICHSRAPDRNTIIQNRAHVCWVYDI